MFRFFFSIFLILNVSISFGREAPKMEEKLALTCKIWGFLKYYHPNVASGKFDWDYGLISILPIIEKTNSIGELNKIGVAAIISLGGVQICETCSDVNENWDNKNFDLSWTDNERFFSLQMINSLDYIEKNRFQENEEFKNGSYYVKRGKWQEAFFRHENVDSILELPERDFRLLDLFRYWNTIEYFFPYKYQMDQAWDSTLIKIIPDFLKVETTNDFHRVLQQLIAKINDGHANFVTKCSWNFKEDKMIPVLINFVHDVPVIFELVNDSLLIDKNIQIGDVVTHIDDVSVDQILKERECQSPASNISAKRRNNGIQLSETKLDSVKISLNREGQIINEYLNSYDIDYLGDKFSGFRIPEKWKKINGNIGYVNLESTMVNDVAEMMNDLIQCRAIIFDLRNYPNRTLFEIGQYLVIDPWSFALFTVPDLNYPGRFIWKNANFLLEIEKPAIINKKYLGPLYTGEIFVLVDEWTQSQAEAMAMCFQSYSKCTVVGSQTSGAVGWNSKIPFFSGSESVFSGIGVYYPDSTEIQRVGVHVDYFVEPTIEGIKNKQDEILEFAVKLANKRNK